MSFCLVDHPMTRAAGPASWPGGRSIVDQVCLDIPPSVWEEECRFWADLTGWELYDVDSHHEFLRFGWELVGPDGAVALAGLDVAEVADDGRLRRVTGFFGPLAPID